MIWGISGDRNIYLEDTLILYPFGKKIKALGSLLRPVCSPAMCSGHEFSSVEQSLNPIRKLLVSPITCMPLLHQWTCLLGPLLLYLT